MISESSLYEIKLLHQTKLHRFQLIQGTFAYEMD